ncbi:hypothetical protein [Orenia marismortui]|uniref:Uncharacterized protein n=1 Tax=Orenia marismortui TaxID=46469 RepID=A0A4R8H063_9FIRM|nr:hypothetical protein [Orenia marismortui]TDX51138.1 hypothetical protein C7959_11514 [Orenia marismortui]
MSDVKSTDLLVEMVVGLIGIGAEIMNENNIIKEKIFYLILYLLILLIGVISLLRKRIAILVIPRSLVIEGKVAIVLSIIIIIFSTIGVISFLFY